MARAKKRPPAEGKQNIAGSHLQIIDPETGEVITSFVSGADTYAITGLMPGKTYALHEEKAPKGYLLASDILFAMQDGKTINMYDKPVKPAKPVKKQGSSPQTGDYANFNWSLMYALILGSLTAAVLVRRKMDRASFKD